MSRSALAASPTVSPQRPNRGAGFYRVRSAVVPDAATAGSIARETPAPVARAAHSSLARAGVALGVRAALTPGQLLALVRVVSRELAWGLRTCSREVRRWRSRAAAIPDATLRADALVALTRKRPHLDGAALFTSLPRRRNDALLRALVDFQIVLEHLDAVNERAAHAGVRNGHQLHLALRDALNPGRAPVDYYRHNPAQEDGGCLRALVGACQQACAALPSYPALRGHLLEYADSLQVLALNHEPDARRRERRLRQWAARERGRRRGERWHELAGEATGSLAIHGLLALATRERVQPRDVELALAAYPRMGALATMLDSYVDQERDAEHGTHSYIAHYSDEEMIERVAALIGECLTAAPALPGDERNEVLVASMVAMYLSSDDAQGPRRPCTRQLRRAGGPLARLLAPALRAWRLAYGLRDA